MKCAKNDHVITSNKCFLNKRFNKVLITGLLIFYFILRHCIPEIYVCIAQRKKPGILLIQFIIWNIAIKAEVFRFVTTKNDLRMFCLLLLRAGKKAIECSRWIISPIYFHFEEYFYSHIHAFMPHFVRFRKSFDIKMNSKDQSWATMRACTFHSHFLHDVMLNIFIKSFFIGCAKSENNRNYMSIQFFCFFCFDIQIKTLCSNSSSKCLWASRSQLQTKIAKHDGMCTMQI